MVKVTFIKNTMKRHNIQKIVNKIDTECPVDGDTRECLAYVFDKEKQQGG